MTRTFPPKTERRGRIKFSFMPIILGLFVIFPLCSLARGYTSDAATPQRSDLTSWSYRGDRGPAHWGELNQGFTACKNGQLQSPVAISGARFERLPSLSFSYRSSPLTITNDGHSIAVGYEPGSFLRVGPKRYELKNIVFHTPGEHMIDGRRAMMGVHLIHRDNLGNFAIVAVSVEGGTRRNAMLERLWEHVPQRSGDSKYYRHVGINPIFILPSNRSYYSYIGSLTMPPCTEGVRWYLLKNPVSASAGLIRRFQAMTGDNSRPLQAINNRSVISVRR